MPFPRWGRLNLPRLKIQSWRFEKKEGARGQRGSEKTSAWLCVSDSDRDGVRGSPREEKERPSGGLLKGERERKREMNREARAEGADTDEVS